jgi:membrane-associated phospholipid phosphatase
VVVVTGLALVDSGWHDPSDVLGGWCLGISWVSALWLLAPVRLGRLRRGVPLRDRRLIPRDNRPVWER